MDKIENTYEADEEYKAFMIRLEQPEMKRPSAEVQYDQREGKEEAKIDHKNLPLIKFLRERAEKKLAEKKLLKYGTGKVPEMGTGSRGDRGGRDRGRKGDRGDGGESSKKDGGSGKREKGSSGKGEGGREGAFLFYHFISAIISSILSFHLFYLWRNINSFTLFLIESHLYQMPSKMFTCSLSHTSYFSPSPFFSPSLSLPPSLPPFDWTPPPHPHPHPHSHTL